MTDIFITGSTGAIGQRILPKLEEKYFKVIRINLREPNELDRNTESSDNSWMIHLASLNSKMTEGDINVEKNMIESAIDTALVKGVKNFIFFSSSKLYPLTVNPSLASENSNVYLDDPYSKGKMECESIIKKNIEKFKSVSIFRLAPVLIRSRSSNVNLLFKMCELLPLIPMFSAGDNNLRSFLSFPNLELILADYLLKDLTGLNVYNVCDKSPISTNMLIDEFLNKYRPNVIKFRMPKILEYLALKMPILGMKLNSLYADNVIDNNKLCRELYNLNLLDTLEAIKLYDLE